MNSEFKILDVEKEIKDSKFLARFKINMNDTPINLDINQYRTRLLAISDEYPEEILGHADFIESESYSNLISHMDKTEELNFLRVEPQYFGNGIGSLLINAAIGIAKEQKKNKFIIKPERPGKLEVENGDISHEERGYLFPYSTNDLRHFYSKFGFKSLTKEEFSRGFLYLNAFAPYSSPNPVTNVPVPDPIFNDSLTDKILQFFYKKNIHRKIPWVGESIHRKIPWDVFKEARGVKRQKNIEMCENYKYLKKYMIRHL